MNNNEPIINCPDCGSDGFNIVNGQFVICARCCGQGLIVIE